MAVKRNNTRMKQSENEVARMQGETHVINVIHTIPYHTSKRSPCLVVRFTLVTGSFFAYLSDPIRL